jgi:chromosome segregation ATPase
MLKLSAEKARAVMREEELTELDEQEFQHNMDEEFPVPDFATFDVQTPRAGTPQGAGVKRTQSGSIIHDISMRPTPAPSSPGAERDRRYGDDEDVFADQQREHLRTPESLPDRRASQSDEQQQPALANTIDAMEKEITKHVTEIQTLKDTVTRLQSELDTLTGTADDHKSRIADLEGETNELESGKRDLQQCLADRDRNITQLQATIFQHEQAAVQLNETLSQKEASLSEISIEAERLLRSKNEILAGVQRMEDEMTAARSENRRLTDELASSYREKESLRERMVELVRTTEERQGELAQALSVAQNEARQGAVLAQELLVMTKATKELEKQLSEANSTAMTLDVELAEVLGYKGQLQLALEGSRKEIEELKSKITFAEMKEAGLSSKLLTADAMRQSLEDAAAVVKNASRVERVKAQSTILGLLEKIDGLQILRDDEVRGFADRITVLEGEIEDLRSNLHNVNKAQQSALAALKKSKDDFAHLEILLAAEQTTCNGLRDSLAQAQKQSSRLKAEKTACESTIINLKAIYDQGKRMQTDWMSGMESMFAPAQLASESVSHV